MSRATMSPSSTGGRKVIWIGCQDGPPIWLGGGSPYSRPSETLLRLRPRPQRRQSPVIFAVSEDPVRSGLVASLARPGGNLTGVNFLTAELGAKRLELLRELVPGAVKVAVLVDPAIPPTATTLREVAGMPRGRNRRSRKTHATIAAFRVRFARAGRLWLALLRAAANPCFSQLASGSLRPQYFSFPCRRSHTHSGCPPDAPWPRCAPSAASGDDSLGSEPRAVRLYGPASHSPSSPAASANRTGHLRRYRGALATCIGS